MKALGIDNILGFDWLASPSPETMIRALEVLYSLGVLDDDAKLTSPIGFQVAEIPLVCVPLHAFMQYNVSSLYGSSFLWVIGAKDINCYLKFDFKTKVP